jgi:hypothetical protein
VFDDPRSSQKPEQMKFLFFEESLEEDRMEEDEDFLESGDN